MNPLTNRWAALFTVAAILLIVSELVGTDEQGGVLSRAAGTYAASDGEALPPGVVQVVASPADAAETPEEDMPQVVLADSPDIVDAEDAPEASEDSEPIEIDLDAPDDSGGDSSGDEYVSDQ